MRRLLPLFVVLATAGPIQAAGLLIPVEKKVPPLAMLNHHVSVTIDDQVAVTKVEQTFRNHTSNQLEATYIFPVPKGASVRKFSMWVDGKEVTGELVEAEKARQIYTSIIQRTQDPGLLEYMGNNLLRLRVFPIPPRGDQKIMVSFTSVANRENGLVEYVYPLKSDGRAAQTLEKFSMNVDLKSQHPIQNVYSPSHSITMTRPSDRRAVISFEKNEALLDRDFQLYYAAGGKDVGLTALTHRPVSGAPGYFMLLLSPRAELPKDQQIPRDMVFVLDTSGSMRGKRMTQARNALKYCLENLGPKDRFALLNFATTVNKYSNDLLPATKPNLEQARKWVEDLEASGGTAINDALMAALGMRTKDATRTFNIVFFTDGRPTIGETNSVVIRENVLAKNTANTRIFTFGVGDDVNAAFLDGIAEHSKALSTYVREFEDIESKVSSLYAKISNPVLTGLTLTFGDNIKISEVYPPQLPDLFHGAQLVVIGRYTGQGHAAIKLTGSVGKDSKEFVHEISFPEKTGADKTFVEDLWARRKVGYLLDQIRLNGEGKEMLEEVINLSKRYGITTPYTSYLIVPDAPLPKVALRPGEAPPAAVSPQVLITGSDQGGQAKVKDILKGVKDAKEGAAKFRTEIEELRLAGELPGQSGKKGEKGKELEEAGKFKTTLESVRKALREGDREKAQAGGDGVVLALTMDKLRQQTQLGKSAVRRAGDRTVIDVGGVWIDEEFDPKAKIVTVKAMSAAYFRILERHAATKQVFQLGNHLVWVTPSNTALVIDTTDGVETMTDADIDRLFTAAKKK